MSDAEFVLKSTPPRVPRASLLRERLVRVRDDVRESTCVFVVAPPGYGKTTLLLQWRRRWLEKGAQVAWMDADPQDEPMRFALAARYAMRAATGRGDAAAAATGPGPGPGTRPGRPIDVLTAMLADVARLGAETVLMIDQAERLPAATLRVAVQYLLLNAPGNLRVVLGSREALPLRTAVLAAHGHAVLVGVDDLRLRQDEALEVLARRLGSRIRLEDGMRLQDIAEGWPLGLQLAVAAIEHEEDLAAAVRRLSARRGHLQDYFVESLPAWLSAPAYAFLIRVAILEHMNVELCRTVSGDADAAAHLDELVRRTPVLASDEGREWYRLHPLARDFLLARFEDLPVEERLALHARASQWYETAGLHREAAHHALAAGDEARVRRLAAQSLWMLATAGRLAEAGDWLARIPADVLAQDPTLRLVASWVHLFGAGNAEALQHGLTVAADPESTPGQRLAALRLVGSAALYADRLDLVVQAVSDWPVVDPQRDDPVYSVAPLNGSAALALEDGDSAQVQALTARVLAHGSEGSLRLASAFATVLLAMSHLADAEPRRAEALLRPALQRLEREDGRRGALAGMLAASCAAAVFDAGDVAAAEAMLADRLDVIEIGLPESVHSAYRTLVRAALSRGDERRALTLLTGLDSVGQRRAVPRLRVHALAEQVRLHAVQGRRETADRLLRTLDRVVATLPPETVPALLAKAQLAAAIAGVHAALARPDLVAAAAQLDRAEALAARWNRGRERLTISVLRAMATARAGQREPATRLLAEARGLAAIGGVARLLVEAHPQAVALAEDLLPDMAPATNGSRLAAARTLAAAVDDAAPTQRAGLLTAKEAEILTLLGRGLSNKAIARALDVSAETVKWHLKNVFAKLGAGTRRHAVERARLLGLVAA